MRSLIVAVWITLTLFTAAGCKATHSDLHPVGGSDEGMNLFDDD